MTPPGVEPALDVVIPVYNEGGHIVEVLDALARHVRTPLRVYVCYDRDDDDTLPVLAGYRPPAFDVTPVRNRGRGPHAAVLTGLAAGRAPAVLVLPADDTYNAPIIDRMFEEFQQGSRVVVASRFMRGGSMVGCPWLKSALVRVAAFTLHTFAGVPTHDPTNGFRLFSRALLDEVGIESTEGFVYSLELLVKCHRAGWRISEIPAQWHARSKGLSRFRLFGWLGAYLRWYVYAFATTYLRRRRL